MTRTSLLSLRPVIALAIAAALAVLLLGAHERAEAGGPNSLSINPTQRSVAPGGSTIVQLFSDAPAESLAAWVIDVGYDPEVVTFDTCTSLAIPPGAIGVSECVATDRGGSPDNDAVVVLGAMLFIDTERGIDGPNALATITFDAVGDVGECSDLIITFDLEDYVGPDPGVSLPVPSVVNGEICIVEQAGVERIWGDFDCNGTVDPIDSLKLLRYDAGLSVAQTGDCPGPGSVVNVDGTDRQWGDLDCGGSTDPIDSLKTLRHDAGLSVARAAGCPDPASAVDVIS